MRFTLVACLLTLSLLNPAVAAAAHPAQEVVKTTAKEVLERLREDQQELKANPEKIYSLVYEKIIPHFDFKNMSKWVLGRNWRGATEAQQQQFTREFQVLLVRTYAKSLLQYADQEIKYAPVNDDPDSELVTVRTEVQQSGSSSIPINYKMHQVDAEWQVVDVSVNGVSLVSTYRGSFASEVRRGGIESLLSKLEQRNAESNAALGTDGGE
mgnify:CR=1 FL=1